MIGVNIKLILEFDPEWSFQLLLNKFKGYHLGSHYGAIRLCDDDWLIHHFIKFKRYIVIEPVGQPQSNNLSGNGSGAEVPPMHSKHCNATIRAVTVTMLSGQV